MIVKTDELISIVESLPIDIKTKLVEKILSSLHPIKDNIDSLWAKEAEKRLKEIKSKETECINSTEVFEEIIQQ